MTEQDDCDIDTLTAFLEESDDNSDDACEESKEKKNDQCDMDEISAFLEESDAEDAQGDDANCDPISESQQEATSSNNSAKKSNEVIDSSKKDAEDGDDMNEFSDFDEMDLNEIDSFEASQNDSVTSKEPPTNRTETNSPAIERVPDTKEESDDSGEEDQTAHDAIKAEMEAMAQRMKELQNLLVNSTPKQKGNHDKSKKDTKTIHGTKKENSTHKQKTTPSPGGVKNSKPSSSVLKDGISGKSSSRDHKTKHIIGKSPDRKEKHSKSPKITDKNKEKKTPSPCGAKSTKPTSSGVKDGISCKSLSRDNNTKHIMGKSPDTKDRHSKSSAMAVKNKTQLAIQSTSKAFMAASKTVIPSSSPKFTEKSKSFGKKAEDDINPFFNETGGHESTVKVDAKTIFGDSDDSDWEDLAGDEKVKLSDQGKSLKKILNGGVRSREAHTPKYDPAILKKPAVSTWTGVSSQPVIKSPNFHSKVEVEKPKLNPETGTVSGKYKVKSEYMPKSDMPALDDKREFVQDPYCGIRIVNPRISMSSFKTKMDGRSMIKISRLLSKFGTNDLQKDNWVTLGVVVHKTEPRQSATGKTYCIWKLSDLVNCDQTVTFFLFGNVYKEHWKNELGLVIGLLNPSVMDKAEKVQSEIALTINHPQQVLVLGVSKDLGRCRGTTKAGTACGNFINRTQGEFCTYHVQTAYRKTSSKRTELQASTGRAPKAFDEQKRAGSKSTAGCFFYGGQTFTTMTPRTSNPKDKVTLKKLQVLEAGKDQGKLTTMSLHELKPEDTQKLNKLREKDKPLLDLLSVPTVGSMNFVKHLVKKDRVEKKVEEEMCEIPSVSAKDLLKQHQVVLKEKQMVRKTLSAVPKLGKGFHIGQEISLDVNPKRSRSVNASTELAKQLAIAKVKSKGGLNREDPNAVRKKITSPDNREKIKKRVAEDMHTDDQESNSEPPKKKSKLLGDLDLNSDEVQKLLKVKSKHKGALAEAEAEHEERYFSSLEKKERMEEKMDSIMEVPVTLFICKQCNYKFYSLHDRCKQENHVVKRVSGVKRFYKCKQCKKRCTSFDKMPTKPCKECGSSSFERVSMLKERSGPKLESEELSIRGNEQKYVGSIQGKAFLSV